jgi:hypothetical protein
MSGTTVAGLEEVNTDYKTVGVEEMDLPKGCGSEDSRFLAEKGFSFAKYPGMIFQKDQTTDHVSKIRLTKQFAGKLPDGNYVAMNKLLLKDLLKLYPKVKNTRGSRGCSDYWNFSNDTLSFYVKIDKNKQPQFPIDEAYFANNPVEAADLLVSCYSFSKDAGQPIVLENPDDPLFFLDSIRVNRGVLEHFQPSAFATMTVYKGADAIKIAGPNGKNGVIYFETKQDAKMRYWTFFKSKSAEYAKIVPDPEKDSGIQYILNKKPLKQSYEPDLSEINNKNFKSITIITNAQLAKEYGVLDKDYGVIILADLHEK